MVRALKLTPAEVDEVWARWRSGQAVKVLARQMRVNPSTVRDLLHRTGGIRPAPRALLGVAVVAGRTRGDLRGLAAGQSLRSFAAGLGRAASTVSREVAANGGRPISGGPCRAAGLDQIHSAEAMQARRQPVLRARGREAKTAVVASADRRLAEDHLPRRPGDAGVARDDLSHPVHPVPRRTTQGADRSSADQAGDPSPSRHPVT